MDFLAKIVNSCSLDVKNKPRDRALHSLLHNVHSNVLVFIFLSDTIN